MLLLLLVLDQVARALGLLDPGAAQRPLGGEVLARLQRLLVPRVDLQRLLVQFLGVRQIHALKILSFDKTVDIFKEMKNIRSYEVGQAAPHAQLQMAIFFMLVLVSGNA